MSSITKVYLFERTPPSGGISLSNFIALVNSADGSAKILTLPVAFKLWDHAPVTNASFTVTQATTS